MLDRKSIVIILLIAFFYESTGLECYHGTRMEDSLFETYGPITLITCPPNHLCFRGRTRANSYVNVNFGCIQDNLFWARRHKNACYTDQFSFVKCVCNTNGCNRDEKDK